MEYLITSVNLSSFNMLFVMLFGVTTVVTGQQGIPTDYCAHETFDPECPQDSVIVMKSATYGLMRTGKCINDGFNNLGCHSNQLAFLDSQCSGLPQCEVAVDSRDLKDTTDCPKEITSYLEASYTCQKVLKPPASQCTSAITMKAKGAPVFIASSVARTTSCGLSEAPLVIEAEPGQKINVTLYDFAWNSKTLFGDRCPKTYGHILSTGSDDVIEICGGSSSRVTHIHLSASNQVQIVLDNQAVQDSQFLLQYEAIGCPDIVPPRNAWLKKDKDGVTVGCHSNSQEWEMKCVGKHWIGTAGNCSVVAVVAAPDVEKAGFNEDHVISMAIGSLALVVCCITITIGVYVVKKNQYKAVYGGAGNYMVPIPYKGAPTPGNTGVYAAYRHPSDATQTRTAGRGGPGPNLDFNNSVPTGYSFQRPSTSGASSGGPPQGRLHQTLPGLPSNMAMVQVHAVPQNSRLPAPTGRAPRPPNSQHSRSGSSGGSVLLAQAVNNSRTMAYNSNPNSGGPTARQLVANANATRTLPPPPPLRGNETMPSQQQQLQQQNVPLPLNRINESKPMLISSNNPDMDTYPQSTHGGYNADTYNTDTYNPDTYNTDTGPTPRGGMSFNRSHGGPGGPEAVTLLGRGPGPQGLASPPPPSLASSGEREDDDSVKYYVLEGPNSSIRPTLNSDPEYSE